jgi:hypothetical protein
MCSPPPPPITVLLKAANAFEPCFKTSGCKISYSVLHHICFQAGVSKFGSSNVVSLIIFTLMFVKLFTYFSLTTWESSNFKCEDNIWAQAEGTGGWIKLRNDDLHGLHLNQISNQGA